MTTKTHERSSYDSKSSRQSGDLGWLLFYCYNFVIIDYVRPYIVEAYDGISLQILLNSIHGNPLWR